MFLAGLFYLADLFTMYGLPAIVGRPAAIGAMEQLHLVYRWPVTLGTLLLIAVGVLRNLRERDRTERVLRHAQKMEAIGRLAGGVAHDFNNVLTVIMGRVALAKSRVPDGDPVNADLDRIIEAAERSTSITRDLLAFGRKQALQPRVFDVNELIARMTPMLQLSVGDGVSLQLQLHEGLNPVHADPAKVEQVIVNLVINAKDPLGPGRTITIATGNTTQTPRDDLVQGRPGPGPMVVIAVRDNGAGMDESTVSQIFDPFFTTKGSEGTGLGLAMVHGILEQSAGALTVTSAPGEGSHFRVFLPVAVRDAVEGPSRMTRRPAPSPGFEASP